MEFAKHKGIDSVNYKDGLITVTFQPWCERDERLMKSLEELIHKLTKTAMDIVSIISIVMPTAVILLNDMQDYSNMQVFCKVGISMASSIAAIANGVGSLYQWHDRAVEYRSCAEKIKSETVRYIAGLGEYEDVMEKDPLFLNYLETISLSENENWIAGENSGRGANQH